MEWKPIESAPKDGSWFLGCMSGSHPETGNLFVPAVVHWCPVGGWTENDLENDATCWNLSHWMPLPAPPITD